MPVPVRAAIASSREGSHCQDGICLGMSACAPRKGGYSVAMCSFPRPQEFMDLLLEKRKALESAVSSKQREKRAAEEAKRKAGVKVGVFERERERERGGQSG